jgi:hypothetical protein
MPRSQKFPNPSIPCATALDEAFAKRLSALESTSKIARAAADEIGVAFHLPGEFVCLLGQGLFEACCKNDLVLMGKISDLFLGIADSVARREQIILAVEKFKDFRGNKIEAALDDLGKEIRGNPKASEIFESLRKELAGTV